MNASRASIGRPALTRKTGLDLLVASGAEGLVSKDKHLLRMADRVKVPVITPGELKAMGFI